RKAEPTATQAVARTWVRRTSDGSRRPAVQHIDERLVPAELTVALERGDDLEQDEDHHRELEKLRS
ncbi:MAG: hypothetical protein K0S65_4737, partial [Labilithrix sp.]|nr:hypothetical protein [Labilithrix sp.]